MYQSCCLSLPTAGTVGVHRHARIVPDSIGWRQRRTNMSINPSHTGCCRGNGMRWPVPMTASLAETKFRDSVGLGLEKAQHRCTENGCFCPADVWGFSWETARLDPGIICISHPAGGQCCLPDGISRSFPYASALVVCVIYVSIWDMVYFLLFETGSY